MTEPVIQLKDVSLTLGEGASSVHVLKGVEPAMSAQGEATGIVGPSGSGKSTLLMVLAGLERVDAGTVSIAGDAAATAGRGPASRPFAAAMSASSSSPST